MVEPIRSENIAEAKEKYFPDVVINTWNEIIAKKYSGGYAKILQDEIAALLVERLGMSRNEVFNNNFLDIEDLYRSYGWKVDYDKPGFNESYPASFTFRKK